MPGLQVVLDTNVLIAALRSPRGASYRALQLLDKGFFDISSSNAIVTFNKRDFRGCERFGVRLLTPAELLQEIGVLK